jgi:hypothetical protein
VTQPQVTGTRARLYVLVSIWLVVCAIFHLFFASAVFPNGIFWLTYYLANYKFGFVRRGLGGELIRLFPQADYFTVAYTLMWASVAVWLIAVAVLMWLILSTGARSERRIMLALAVPVLPFSFFYAVYSPRPELFGMAALLAFGVSLTTTRNSRSRMILSVLYGMATALLALMHEAIPLELALGAILVIIVVSKRATRAAQRICAVLAVAPGIVSVLLIAALSRRNVASQVCAQVPHGMVENPWAVATTPQGALDYMLGRVASRSDYHDWACQNAIPILDADWSAAVRMVAHFGFVQLFGAFILGLLFFVGTIWAIRYFSGVPVRAFLGGLRGNVVLPVLAAGLMVPLFLTGVDWTRWWVLATFDVAIGYILYAIDRPEIEEAPSRRNVLIFVAVVTVLAVIPTGGASNVGG